MRARGHTFRQSLWVTVVTGSSVTGACSDGDGQGVDASAPLDTNSPTVNGAGGTPVAAGDSTTSGGGSEETASSADSTSKDNSGNATGNPSERADGVGGNAPVEAGGSNNPSGGDNPGSSDDPAGDSPTLAGAGGADGTEFGCPESLTTSLADPNQRECTEPGMACDVPVDCNSETQFVTMTCEDGRWQGPTGCDKPYDYCPDATGGTDVSNTAVYCVNGTWSIQAGPKHFGPVPCPAEPPTDGMECDVLGGTDSGSDREHCGYPCDDPSQWTVLSCIAAADGRTGAWSSDGACDSRNTPSSR